MPEKKLGMTPYQQIEKFRALVKELEAAGELNPTEADERFELLMKKAGSKRAAKEK